MPYWDEMQERAPEDSDAEISSDPINSPDATEATPEPVVDKSFDQLVDEIHGIRTDVSSLNDLFVRRLLEDRQKAELIRTLQEISSFAVIEPFLHDLILLLDRIERVDDDFAKSIVEELLDVLERRGIKKIVVTREFNPDFQKVVRVADRPDLSNREVIGIVRNGYVLGDKVIRPAEVVIGRPAPTLE